MTIDRLCDTATPRERVRQALGDVEVLRDAQTYWSAQRRAQRMRIASHERYIGMVSVRMSAGHIARDVGRELIAQVRTELLIDKFDHCMMLAELAFIERSILALERMDFATNNR